MGLYNKWLYPLAPMGVRRYGSLRGPLVHSLTHSLTARENGESMRVPVLDLTFHGTVKMM